MKNFELTFEGAATACYFPRYRRRHETIEAARLEADRVYRKLGNDDLPIACHRYEILDGDARVVANG